MRNVKTSLKGKILTIEIDTAAQGENSASGKTIVLASTEGNQSIEGLPSDMKLGLNFYKTNPQYVKPSK